MKAKKRPSKKKKDSKVKNGGVKKASGSGTNYKKGQNKNNFGGGGGGGGQGQGPSRPQKKSRAGGRKAEWNLVPIAEECLTDKAFENLVSFEEMLDYDVVTNADGTKEIMSGGNEPNGSGKTKRKTLEEADDPDDDDYDQAPDDDEIMSDTAVPAKVKKVKKRKKESKVELDNDLEDGVNEVIFTSAGPVIVEEVEASDEDETLDVDLQQSVPGGKLTYKAEGNGDVRKKADKKEKNVNQNQKKDKQRKNANNGKAKKGPEENWEEPCSEEDENDEFEEQEWVKLGVPDIIIRSLKAKEFNKPTNIQLLTLPAAILGKKDVVGAAETGSGKTLAFAIPIIDGILKGRERSQSESNERDDDDDEEEEEGESDNKLSLKALILTPTRELAVQIKNHFDVAAKHTTVKTVVIVGGLAAQKQERILRSQPDVVIATPGRLWELLQQGDPHLSTLNQIKYLAIDETDRMVEKGHFQELEGILNVVNTNQKCKDHRQNFVFSATLAFTHEPPQRLKKAGDKKVKYMQKQPKKISSKDKLKQIMDMVGVRPNPKIVDITTSKGTCETLTEMQINCSLDHKDYYLYYFLLCNPGRTIVFCNSINCVRRLTNLFFLLQCGEVLPLHSEMHQKQRLRNLERFTENEKGVLIATDVAARGLDIKNINHVIHYQVPKTAESYIHRSGRTARAFKGGIAILMIEPAETTLVTNIFRSLGRDEMLPDFNVNGKTFRDIKDTIGMAIKVEKFEHSVRKQLADHNWMEKTKKDMDLASSSDESDDEQHGGATTQKKSLMKSKKQLEKFKAQLSQMVVNNEALLSRTLKSSFA